MPSSLTRFLAPKVLPTARGSRAGRLSTASLLAPEVPRASLPREPRRLHQPPVPVLNRAREKNTANTQLVSSRAITSTGCKAIKTVAFIYIVIFLCGPKTLHVINGKGEPAERWELTRFA